MDVETFAHSSQQLQTPARGDRVARTRDAIVGSALALALAGEVAPIVRDIAKMAGVSARTCPSPPASPSRRSTATRTA